MPRLQFGASSYDSARGGLPALPVINMFVEPSPVEDTGIVLQSRPGLANQFAMSTGPVDALFKGDGALAGSLFGISNTVLHSGTDVIGTVDGPGPFSIDGYDDRLFIAGGGQLWTFHGITLSALSFPDSANVTKVLVAASRAVCIRDDTQKVYWSDVLGTTIDALAFAEAESAPDRLRDMLFIDDILILFGAETVEFWPNTGDADLPFQPLEGRVFERGIKATGCAAQFGSTFAWVTDTGQVCISDPENIISAPWLEAKIAATGACRLWTFFLNGTEFLALRLDTGTWVYSSRSKLWSEMQSYGQTNWIPQCFAGNYFGSALNGNVMQWTTAHVDLDGVLERRVRGGFPLNSGGVVVNNVIARCEVGDTPFLTGSASGDYTSPIIEMRTSRDGGKTWGRWRESRLGPQGDYRRRVQWTACGMFGAPGMMAEFRVTDPVPCRFSDFLFNEKLGAY